MTRPELTEAMARAIYDRVNGHGCRPWRQIAHKSAYCDQAIAALAAIEAAGCVVVPKEPTWEMLRAGIVAVYPDVITPSMADAIYRAMIAAPPASPLAKDA